MKTQISLTLVLVLISCGEKRPGPTKDAFLKQAESLKPSLIYREAAPVGLIKPERDQDAWRGWTTRYPGEADSLADILLRSGDAVILDFGRYYVGHLAGICSSSAKLKIEPAEVLIELVDHWKDHPAIFGNGFRPKRTWSPFIVDAQDTWNMPERMAFRYVRITVLESQDAVTLDKIVCREVSGVPFEKIQPLTGFNAPIQKIDHISQHTLRNCIQDVFEDGPKRDRRLWLGDLRLQAKLDDLIFQSFDIQKRCLLLFAGSVREDGFIPACVFTPEDKEPYILDEMIPDYAMLYGSVLLDYYMASGDLDLVEQLYPLAKQQVDLVCGQWLAENNVLQIPANIWTFIDWSPGLDHQAAEQATAIYAINQLIRLAEVCDLKGDIMEFKKLRDQLIVGATTHLFDFDKRLFVSGENRQVSWASQIWMILAGVVGGDEGAEILRRVANEQDAIKPGCPYLMHHLVEAYFTCNMDRSAFDLIMNYWGGMVRKGADTFWEVYDADDPFLSPYNSHLFNSYCHAWSCTPAYFFRHPEYGLRIRAILDKNL